MQATAIEPETSEIDSRGSISLRTRLSAWIALSFAIALVALTAAVTTQERREFAELESVQARALLSHLAEMREFRGDPQTAARHLQMVQALLAVRGVAIELRESTVSALPDRVLAEPNSVVQSLDVGGAPMELRYQVDSVRMRDLTLHSIAMHAAFGVLALAALLFGTRWILNHNLVAPIDRIVHQLERMRTGGGWLARVPESDAELGRLVAAVRALGPGLARQVEEWVRGERSSATALALLSIVKNLRDPLRELRLHASELQTQRNLPPETTRQVRKLLAAADSLVERIRQYESREFGPTSSPAQQTSARHVETRRNGGPVS